MSIILTRDDGLILRLDGYESIDYDPQISLTEHPVELGAVVTDHAQKRALRFRIVNALVTPTRVLAPNPAAVSLAFLFFETAAGHLITVDTLRDGLFVNCMLESWPNRQTRMLGRSFDLSFKQIAFATPIAVVIPPRLPSPSAGAGVADEVDTGAQAAGAAGAGAAGAGAGATESTKSALAAVADVVTGGA